MWAKKLKTKHFPFTVSRVAKMQSAALDFDQIMQFALMGSMAVAGWFMRMLWSMSQSLKEELFNLKVSLPRDYILREDYREDLNRIHELLEKIYDKIDKKVDKYPV